MAGIETYLEEIISAVYGKDVRQAIHDAIAQCYEDASTGMDTVARSEISDARIGKNEATYDSLGAAIRAQDISTSGINLFDKSTAKSGKYINLAGNEIVGSGFYCSDFIKVNPNTDYVTIGVGSASSYLTCAFYDSSKAFISASFNVSATAYTLTTPSNCAYVRVNVTTANLNRMYFVLANENPAVFSPYRRIVDGISSNGVFLFSGSTIRYDYEAGELYANSSIFLCTQEKRIDLGSSVSVGQGAFLYWGKATGTLVASNTYPINDNNVYLVCVLRNQIYDGNYRYTGISSRFPIFEYDMVNSVLHIRTMSYPAVIFDNGSTYTIPANYEQDLELTYETSFVYYDPKSGVFGETQSISAIHDHRYVYVAMRSISVIESDFPYSVVTNEKSLSKKFIMTWGDSLTWYDGQEFTWGEHQGEICKGYQSYLRSYLGLVVSQLGASGKTTPEICNSIMHNSLDFTAYDYMTIMSGDNDDRLSVPIGTLLPVGSEFDTTTVIGALQSAVEHSLTQNPKLRIIIMSEPMGWTYVNGAMKRVSSLIPNALRQVAEQYGLPFIDLWSESGINELNREQFYADPAPSDNHLYMYHPNNDGWARISKVICKKILDY